MHPDRIQVQIPTDLLAIINSDGPADELMQRIRRLPKVVEALNAISSRLPRRYGWRFKTAEAFNEEWQELAKKCPKLEDLNKLYWRDSLSNIEGYTISSVWRMVDVVQAVLAALGTDHIVPAAILVRSAFESSIRLVSDARAYSATLEAISNQNFAKNIVVSQDLEKLILKTVFASRMADEDEMYQSTNILTTLSQLGKVVPAEALNDKYELLCEVAHPNFLGRSVYLVGHQPMERPGDEIRFVGPENGVTAVRVRQVSLWALCWAVEAQCTATHLLQTSIRDMFERFPWLSGRVVH